MQEQTFKESIDKRDFDHALAMVNNGEDILKSQWQFKLSDAFPKIIQNKAFELLTALVENDHIELDVFEYDNFNNTIFKELLQLDSSPESLAFLSSFIPKVDNLNDSLNNKTWLSLAFEEGASIEVIQTMIDNGCDVNYVDSHNANLLLIVSQANGMKIKSEKKLSYFRLLIDNGLDASRLDAQNNSVLANVNDTETITLLLENGADPNVANNNGTTAYHNVIVINSNFELANAMAGIVPPDFDAETGKKQDLFYEYMTSYAPKSKQHLEFFQEHGADPEKVQQNVYGKEETVLDVIVKADFEFFKDFFDVFTVAINQADNLGNTILHKVCAIQLNHDANKAKELYRKTKLLIELGADVTLTNTEDKTPMQLAADDNLKEKTVALLLKNQ